MIWSKVCPWDARDPGRRRGITVHPGATVYTDDATAYRGMDRPHETVKHSVAEYVRGKAHTNGVESFWSMLKRAHKGTFHHLSVKHLQRYVNEFAARHNVREMYTLDQMAHVAAGMVGRRLMPPQGDRADLDAAGSRHAISLPGKSSFAPSGRRARSCTSVTASQGLYQWTRRDLPGLISVRHESRSGQESRSPCCRDGKRAPNAHFLTADR